VAEIAADGRRSQIFLAMSTAAEFRDHLTNFSEYYAGLGTRGAVRPGANVMDFKIFSPKTLAIFFLNCGN
jgi:hypothetical protein